MQFLLDQGLGLVVFGADWLSVSVLSQIIIYLYLLMWKIYFMFCVQ